LTVYTEANDLEYLRLFHYTFADALSSILTEGLRASKRVQNDPKSDAQHGNGQYFTDLTPDEASQFSRPQISQALYSTPRKWGVRGKVRDIVWLEWHLMPDMVAYVRPLFSSRPAQMYSERGIWLRSAETALSVEYLRRYGIIVFQPTPYMRR
jgi:hypothetical protein